MLESALYECPYCGEEVETTVDLSAGDQTYIEDCQVCCRPWRVMVAYNEEGDVHVDVEAADDA